MTRMDGGKFSVFDRSVLVSNGVLHSKVFMKTVKSVIWFKDLSLDGFFCLKSLCSFWIESRLLLRI